MALAKYTLSTDAVRTGVQAIYFAIKEAFPTAVTVTSGEISAMTLPALKKFKKIGTKIDTLQVTSDTPEFANTPLITDSVSFAIGGLTKDVNTLIEAIETGIVGGGIQLIITLANGKSFLLGWSEAELNTRPMNKMSFKWVSGSKPGEDENGRYVLTISGLSSYDMVPFDTTISNSIKAATYTTNIDYTTYALSCGAIRTGVLAAYFAEMATASVWDGGIAPVIASNEITGFTPPDESFKETEFKIDTLNIESDCPEFSNTKIITNTVTMTVSGPSAAINTWFTALHDSISCGLMGIFTLGNGTSLLMGYNANDLVYRPINMMAKKYESGAKPGEDGKGVYTVTFKNMCTSLLLPFNSTLNTAIADGSASFISYNA